MYEIKEEDATGHISLIYSDLRKSLNIKVVNIYGDILLQLMVVWNGFGILQKHYKCRASSKKFNPK